jgi:hypothetical protein
MVPDDKTSWPRFYITQKDGSIVRAYELSYISSVPVAKYNRPTFSTVPAGCKIDTFNGPGPGYTYFLLKNMNKIKEIDRWTYCIPWSEVA